MGDTDSLAYLKQRLKLLIPAMTAQKFFNQRKSFTDQVNLGGARVRLFKRKAYRYNTNDMECTIYGSPGSIHIILMEMVRIIKFEGIVINMTADELRELDTILYLKFIVSVKVAERMEKGYQFVIQDICKDGITDISICRFGSKLTTDRCVIVNGRSDNLLKASMFILHVTIECSKPYMDKLKPCPKSQDVWDTFKTRIDQFKTKHYVTHTFGDTLYRYTSNGICITYSYLSNAGFSDDYVKALNFAALVEAGKDSTSQFDLRFQFILGVNDRHTKDRLAGRIGAAPLYIPGSVGNPV